MYIATHYDVMCLCLISAQLIINTPVRASDIMILKLNCTVRCKGMLDQITRDLWWLGINLNDSRFTVEYQNGQPNGAQFGGDNLMYSRV